MPAAQHDAAPGRVRDVLLGLTGRDRHARGHGSDPWPRAPSGAKGAFTLTRLTVRAPAKLNLYLRVLGRRPDGYHELDSLFHTVGLYDRLTLEDGPPGEVDFSCTEPALANDDNLVVRAARAVMARTDGARGVRLHLEKAIPAGAGLGGGSSDAAAVLKGLNRLWGLGLADDALAAMAAGLGSDVPFFLHGGAARVGGRGERVTPVAPHTGVWALLLHPGVAVSTARVFEALSAEVGGRLLTRAASPSIIIGAPEGAEAGAPPASQNDLEKAACRVAPQIAEAIEALRIAGGEGARMTGSGGVVFCLADSRAALERIHERLRPAPLWKVWLVPLTGAEDPFDARDCE